MRFFLSFTMILLSALAVGCGGDASPGGTGGGGASGTEASSSSATSAGNTGATTGGGGASSASGSGGASGQACVSCAETKMPFATGGTSCSDALSTCKTSGTCTAWLDCTDACAAKDYTASCFSACDSAAVAEKSLHDQLYACVCTACADTCGLFCK